MPYTTHGHWYGPGEPTQPGPRLVAKCFGLGGCYDCRTDAGLPPLPEPKPEPKTTSSAETLRAAATVLRDTAAAPDCVGTWKRDYETVIDVDAEENVAYCEGQGIARWVTLMSPQVAEHIAVWLEDAAKAAEFLAELEDKALINLAAPLALSRTILRSAS